MFAKRTRLPTPPGARFGVTSRRAFLRASSLVGGGLLLHATLPTPARAAIYGAGAPEDPMGVRIATGALPE